MPAGGNSSFRFRTTHPGEPRRQNATECVRKKSPNAGTEAVPPAAGADKTGQSHDIRRKNPVNDRTIPDDNPLFPRTNVRKCPLLSGFQRYGCKIGGFILASSPSSPPLRSRHPRAGGDPDPGKVSRWAKVAKCSNMWQREFPHGPGTGNVPLLSDLSPFSPAALSIYCA